MGCDVYLYQDGYGHYYITNGREKIRNTPVPERNVCVHVESGEWDKIVEIYTRMAEYVITYNILDVNGLDVCYPRDAREKIASREGKRR